jgi:hypothetical protein
LWEEQVGRAGFVLGAGKIKLKQRKTRPFAQNVSRVQCWKAFASKEWAINKSALTQTATPLSDLTTVTRCSVEWSISEQDGDIGTERLEVIG